MALPAPGWRHYRCGHSLGSRWIIILAPSSIGHNNQPAVIKHKKNQSINQSNFKLVRIYERSAFAWVAAVGSSTAGCLGVVKPLEFLTDVFIARTRCVAFAQTCRTPMYISAQELGVISLCVAPNFLRPYRLLYSTSAFRNKPQHNGSWRFDCDISQPMKRPTAGVQSPPVGSAVSPSAFQT